MFLRAHTQEMQKASALQIILHSKMNIFSTQAIAGYYEKNILWSKKFYAVKLFT